jgi:flagellar motor switch protein FliM
VSAPSDHHDSDAVARKLSGAMLEHPGFAAERTPGLAQALDQFIVEAPRALAPLFGAAPKTGAIEAAQGTTLLHAIGDCAGLTAAIYASAEPPARLLVALDERIDDLIVATVFGDNLTTGASDGADSETPRSRTAIESALLEEFARTIGRALEAAFAPFASLALQFERLVTLSDAFALGRRDLPAIAARFSLPMNGGACEGLIVFAQSLLLPFRKELERDRSDDAPSADRRWSHLMEAEVKQTRLPVTAILEEVPMSLGDVANLRVGKILPLQNADFDAVRLECSGRSMFLCKLGQGEGRYRLEVESSIAQATEAPMR